MMLGRHFIWIDNRGWTIDYNACFLLLDTPSFSSPYPSPSPHKNIHHHCHIFHHLILSMTISFITISYLWPSYSSPYLIYDHLIHHHILSMTIPFITISYLWPSYSSPCLIYDHVQWLNQLPEPLLGYEHYDAILSCQEISDINHRIRWGNNGWKDG